MVSHAAHQLIAKLLIADGVEGVSVVDPSGVKMPEANQLRYGVESDGFGDGDDVFGGDVVACDLGLGGALGDVGEGFDFGGGFAHRLCDPCACVHVSYFAPVA